MRLKEKIINIGKFKKYYDSEKLKRKLNTVAKTAGLKTVYAVLLAYYSLSNKKVPIKHKAIVIGALGYFICPTDLIPDFLGPLGYTDDLFSLLYSLRIIWSNITPEIHQKAKHKLEEWFPEEEISEIDLFDKNEVVK